MFSEARRAEQMSHPLPHHLSLIVPMLIRQLEAVGGPTDYQIDEARRRGIASADHMLYGGEPDEPAELVTRLAEALAIMAFMPGGVEIFEMRFVGIGGTEETDCS